MEAVVNLQHFTGLWQVQKRQEEIHSSHRCFVHSFLQDSQPRAGMC